MSKSKEYKAFNLESLSSEAVQKAPRILVVGGEKMGKTSFACGDRMENGKIVEWGLNNPVLLPISGEQGADSIPVPKFPVASRHEDVMEAIGSLAKEKHDFRFLVIDSLSTLMRVVKKNVQDEYTEMRDERTFDRYNAGVNLCKPVFEQLREGLDYLRENRDMGSILICHTPQKPKTITDPDQSAYDAWTADLPDAVYSIFSRWADVIIFPTTKAVTKKEDVGFGKEQGRLVEIGNGQRVILTRKSKGHPSGGRGIYGSLPDEIPFTWHDFMEAVSAASN